MRNDAVWNKQAKDHGDTRPGILRRLNAWNRRHRQILDTIKALLLILFLLVLQSSSMDISSLLLPQPSSFVVVWSLIYVIPLAIRRTHTEAGATTFIVMAFAQLILGPTVIMANLTALIMVYSVIVYGKPSHSRRYIAAAVVMGALVAVLNSFTQHFPHLIWSNENPNIHVHTSLSEDALSVFVFLEVFILAAVAMGYWKRARLEQVNLLAERNRALQESQREENSIATLAERSRIARDMHDLVAHTLSTIIVQADGGRYAGASDANLAAKTMQTIEQESIHTKSSLANLLGTLGASEEVAHQPELKAEYSSIDLLLHQARAASGTNLSIERTVHGNVPYATMSPDLESALFHTVEEALSNVRKYAGTGVHVDIAETWSPESVTLNITDDGAGAAASADGHHPGYGLIGMRERIAALGGNLQASALGSADSKEHGFSICATIPLQKQTESMKAVRKANVIERFSAWTQNHFALVDVVTSAVLAILVGFGIAGSSVDYGTGPTTSMTIILSVAFCLPLALRRTRPQLSAGIIAGLLIFSFLFLIAMQNTGSSTALPGTGSLVALVSLYSVLVYGPRTAGRWAYPVSVVIIALASLSIWHTLTCENQRYASMSIQEANREGVVHYTALQITASWVSSAVFIAVTCCAIVFLAQWKRQQGNNIVLLQTQQKELLDQRTRQATLAANLERARISDQIQHDVDATLESVLGSAHSLRAKLELIAERTPDGEKPSAQDSATITEAFANISATGRTALAQMRELLGILRQNETPDQAQSVPRSPIMNTEPRNE